MKCPKCGYLGFETSDRCRNCGYDFSLSTSADSLAIEFPLNDRPTTQTLSDFDLSGLDTSRPDDNLDALTLDLDRVIGEPAEDAAAPIPPDAAASSSTARAPETSAARRPTPDGTAEAPAAGGRSTPAPRRTPLPLFQGEDADDQPLITAPRPPRPPLSVRRTTPEVPRSRTATVGGDVPAGDRPLLADTGRPAAELAPARVAAAHTVLPQAPPGARLGATAIDGVLLALVKAAVVYLTLALVGWPSDRVMQLPAAPLLLFFAIFDGGYLIICVAANGQTIGKLMTGVQVVGDDDQRVDVVGAVLRALGCAVSLATAGLGYLPAFLTADGRAFHDRIAGTRVVSVR